MWLDKSSNSLLAFSKHQNKIPPDYSIYIRHGARKGHVCYSRLFMTCFPIFAQNFLHHPASATPVGYYPTLAPILTTTEWILSTIYYRKVAKKHQKMGKKDDKISDNLFLRQSDEQSRHKRCLYRRWYCSLYRGDIILVYGWWFTTNNRSEIGSIAKNAKWQSFFP